MMDPSMWRQRAVIIHRDENGYGLTVFGDNPVSVQTIKKGGAAEVAGIREGDIIVKVNGTVVEHMTHTEVVNLIKSAGAYVTLTVKPPVEPTSFANMPSVGFLGGNGGRPHHISSSDRVTAPLPVNQDVQLQMQGCKLRTLQAMRDKAAGDVEKLWKKYEQTQDPRDMSDFEKAQQGLKKIESQMKSFRQSSPNLQLHSPVPFGQFSSGHHSVPFQPSYPSGYQQQQQQQYSSSGHPSRNRNPLSGGGGVMPTYGNIGNPMNWVLGDGPVDDSPPPLPPRQINLGGNAYGVPEYPPSPLMGFNNSATPSSNSSNSSSFNNLQNNFQSPTNHDMLNKTSNSSSGSSGQSGHQQNQQQTHHRAKSSPDPVSMQKVLNSSEGSKRSDSFSDLSKKSNSRSRTSAAWGDSVDSNYLSPPGSPPPPYGKFHSQGGSTNDHENNSAAENHNLNNLNLTNERGLGSQRLNQFSAVDIIAMEEDDGLFSNEPITVPSLSGFHGPYSSLSRLLEHNAHLAVFINYVIDSRRDPNSLLFYVITAFDIEEGSLKEMKRWGYEIHSTFTAPGSPLLVPNVDENIAAEIDDALLHEMDKEEMMRRVFRKARNKAKEEINKQLEEFCTKKTAGLGSMYGPPDNQLEESLHDKAKELRIVENYLVPRVEQFNVELEKNGDGRTFAIMIAVATVIVKLFGLRNHQNLNNILEKHGSFVSKDKSMKSRFISKPKKVTHNGHHFVLQCYSSYTECNVCSKLLWGIGPQGQQCVDCNLNIHRSIDTYRTHNCINEIHDSCLGTNQKNKANDKFRRFKERIRPEKDPKKRISKKLSEENIWGSFGDADSGEKPLGSSGSSASNLKGDRRPDTLSEERLASDGFTFEDEDADRVHEEPRKSSTAVGRSESCKERVQRKQTRERRKHSDPNLTSKSSDVDLDNQRQLSDANNSGSSSNSSLSARSLESPSTSLELVAPSNNSSSSLRERNSETPETTVGHSGALSDSFKPSPGWDGDSDIEIEQDPPDWTKNVPEDILAGLHRTEKKRQEVLNELFHTERSHVRNLKVVDRLFHRPLRQQQLLSVDLIQMLFANLEEMLEIHGRFNSSLKKLRMESEPLVGDIGPVLLEMFDGEEGDNFKRAAATFCAKQQIGLELLRERRRKDLKFHAFLTEAESDPVCRRLGIKDMIPMAMQRLTKYPLLFENLCNCTAPDSEEYKNIQRAVDLSKEVLCHVNYAKKEAEDLERLIEIQRKLDKSAFDKGIDKNDPSISEIRNLDFPKHRLIHEGPLLWRMTKGTRQKSEMQEVQAVLLHDMIVILLKQDDRYVLKTHNMGFPAKTDRLLAKPIVKLNNLHHRPVATDKKAFFLISATSANMYELVCSTPEERNVWFHHITKAADDYKNRQESRRSELHPQSNTNIPPSIHPEPEEKHKDSVEGSVEGPPVINESGGETSSKGDAIGLPLINQKEASPAPDSTSSEPPMSPEKSEELKRADSAVQRALEDKLRIASKIFHIPTGGATQTTEVSPPLPASQSTPKDAKEMLVACIQNVDKLIGIVSSQKFSKENLDSQREQQNIHNQLSALLIQAISEVERKDDELEQRRQELHRVREQNHGYQERLQGRTTSSTKQLQSQGERQPSPGNLSSPALSPPHSRPSSFLSLSSNSDQHDVHPEDEPEVVMRIPLKPQLSAPVATSSSNSPSTSTTSTTSNDNTSVTSATTVISECDSHPPALVPSSSMSQRSSSDLAQEEFADAVEDLGLTEGVEESNVETNRESTETEVIMSKNVEGGGESEEALIKTSNEKDGESKSVEVPEEEVKEKQQNKSEGSEVDLITNGHEKVALKNGNGVAEPEVPNEESSVARKLSSSNSVKENGVA